MCVRHLTQEGRWKAMATLSIDFSDTASPSGMLERWRPSERPPYVLAVVWPSYEKGEGNSEGGQVLCGNVYMSVTHTRVHVVVKGQRWVSFLSHSHELSEIVCDPWS